MSASYCRSSPIGSRNTKSGIAVCGPKCRPLCAKPTGATIPCFCAKTGYLETEDFERARAGMAKREVNERWQREMGDFFTQPNGVLPDRAMQPLEEVFHL